MLWFLLSARGLMLTDIYLKFQEDSLNGFQSIERTRVWQTNRRTDRRPGEKQCLQTLNGGDIIKK